MMLNIALTICGFRPLTGINFNMSTYYIRDLKQAFPSPHGDKFQPNRRRIRILCQTFPSPHGDKFQRCISQIWGKNGGFRPLTGINFNLMWMKSMRCSFSSFRPLTGINFNGRAFEVMVRYYRFRPLTGINFNACIWWVRTKYRVVSVPSRG